MKIKKVIELDLVSEYLKKRSLVDRYLKALDFITQGRLISVDFKKINPKNLGIFQFRINKKFRALAYIDGEILVVFEINDHQK